MTRMTRARPRPDLQRTREPAVLVDGLMRHAGRRACWSSTISRPTAPARSPTSWRAQYPGRVAGAAPHRAARPRPCRTSTACSAALASRRRRRLPDGRRPLARSARTCRDCIAATGRRRPRHRLALRARRRDRELAAAPAAPQPVRQPLHPHRHAAARRATARAATAAGGARRSRALPLDRFVSDGYSFLVEMLVRGRRGAGCRIVEVPITFVERRQGASKLSRGGAPRIGDHAVAAGRAPRRGSTARAEPPFVLWFRDFFQCQRLPPQHPPGLSVFFPAYNDSGTIASMVIRAVQAASDADARLRGDRRQRRQRGRDGGDRRRARAHLSARPRRPSPEEPRLRRRAADRLPTRDQGSDLLHRRRRAVRPGGAGGALGAA